MLYIAEEMKSFTLHNCEQLFEFSLTQFVLSVLLGLLFGIILSLTVNWKVGLGVGLGLVFLQYAFLSKSSTYFVKLCM